MSLASDLLEQAEHLARREPRKPKQASLRRAVSAAYHAVFHLLIEEASNRIVKDANLRCLVSRAYSHGGMNKAAKCFAPGGNLPDHITTSFAGTLPTIPAEIRTVARAFKDLQQARHEAEYDLSKSLTRADVIAHVTNARRAFTEWQAVRNRPADRVAVELFLSSLLLWESWGKR
jgi:hypothetical protein